jgi:GT2 family glycosyltransferase/glycosyltransferase involved in cell wall biosynthesis
MLLAAARRLLPRRWKRWLKRFWDPNQPLSLEETLLVARHQSRSDSAAGARRGAYDVLCFSIFAWEFRRQRPQHLMAGLAGRGHRVFYLDVSERYAGGRNPYRARTLEPGIEEIQLPARPDADPYYGEWSDEELAKMLAAIERLRRDENLSLAVSVVQLSSWWPLAEQLRERFGWRVVYDCMDDWSGFPKIGAPLLESERKLLAEADLVTTSSEALRGTLRERGATPQLIRNAADLEHFEISTPSSLLAGIEKPIVGYLGAIAEWFDVDLLRAAAEARPQYQFVLVGGVFDIDVAGLERLENVQFLGEKPYALMPHYLQRFDVAIIPFRRGPLTEATDPVKFYEYLAQGKPVVTTGLPELDRFAGNFYPAADAAGFVEQIDRAIAEDDDRLREARKRIARDNSWDARVSQLEQAMAAIHPSLSVIVVTWNNLDYTRLCLESLFRNTLEPRLEVIVVDNASEDGTRDYIAGLSAIHPELRTIFNDTNVGFARANNQALEIATGERLILLNNDTVVPRGWSTRLLRHLEQTKTGLVVPVTNSSGNESRIEVPYRTVDGIEEFAAARALEKDGQAFDIEVGAMYCAAMRRDAFEKVGLLDERFTIGMFEDDDYSHRMRLAGYRVLCAEDAFVHHWGQASFGKLPRAEYDDLFERNQRLYEEKWGK